MFAPGIKRIYEPPSEADGYRMLVDRLWPRGLRKQDAALHEWNREIAPSVALRRWFGHKAEHYVRFARLYEQELREKKAELNRIRAIAGTGPLTLLYAARDPERNHARILLSVLKQLEDTHDG
jgi:uncharacterized protein YeaO (DUF488 family)